MRETAGARFKARGLLRIPPTSLSSVGFGQNESGFSRRRNRLRGVHRDTPRIANARSHLPRVYRTAQCQRGPHIGHRLALPLETGARNFYTCTGWLERGTPILQTASPIRDCSKWSDSLPSETSILRLRRFRQWQIQTRPITILFSEVIKINCSLA